MAFVKIVGKSIFPNPAKIKNRFFLNETINRLSELADFERNKVVPTLKKYLLLRSRQAPTFWEALRF